MASEGSRGIEAARKRLAAAKAQISVPSKNMEAVKVMMENAKAMSAAAEKEGKEAEAMLKDAEKRWEVINIDLDSDDDESTQKNEGSNKRRKVSLSPQGKNKSNNPVGNNNRIGRTGKNIRIATISFTSNNVTRVAVKGCGISEMNGTYTRVVGILNGAPVFSKRGSQWEGNDVNYAIYRGKSCGTYKWYFGQWNTGGGPSKELTTRKYYHLSGSSSAPPKDGWKAVVWGCDFCEEAQFEDYDEACEHEKICEKNTNTGA